MDYALNARRERTYRHLLPRVVTTFHVPWPGHEVVTNWQPTHDEIFALLRSMPFTCIRIAFNPVQKTTPELQTTVLEVLLEPSLVDGSGSFSVCWSMRLQNIFTGWTVVAYSLDKDSQDNFPIEAVTILFNLLRDSRNRFIEKRLPRHVRRAQGLKAPDYHEYIIIDRRDVKPEDDAKPWKDIARRYPYLHAVRSHLRRLECGRLVQVRAHTRGKGTLFQVKDYLVGVGA